jgi:hypothetical protein
MLSKNVYILYPAGYSGSYVNWAISVSDSDLTTRTVKNPINTKSSNQFGSAGTAHLHVRIPTHHGLQDHLNWVLFNKPRENIIYIINVGTGTLTDNATAIAQIMQYDPTGVFINIHAGSDNASASYGEINGVTKWPTFMKALLPRSQLKVPFDPMDCRHDINFRNYAVKHREFFPYNARVDRAKVSSIVNQTIEWYNVRHEMQPHEVNEQYYNTNYSMTNRIFELSCYDIVTGQFPDILSDILSKSGISSDYDLTHLREFHPSYIAAQDNLQWFSSLITWVKHGTIDDYIRSHGIIEAQIIGRILKLSNVHPYTDAENEQWQKYYAIAGGVSWPVCKSEGDFYFLPESIQQEIKQHGYKLKMNDPPLVDLRKWETMSLDEINSLFQSTRKTI